jgi:hypothetical protein
MSYALVLVVVMAAAALAVLMAATAGRRVFPRPRIRTDPAAAAQRIDNAYNATHDLTVRRALLLEAAALEDAATLRFLGDVANGLLSTDLERNSERAAEGSALRLIAVDGIAALSRNGDLHATSLLRKLVASPDRAVQAAAMVVLKL